LLRSILHRGNSERAHRFAVRLWDVNTSQGLRLIIPTLECMYCLGFLLWCVPNFLVHTGVFLPLFSVTRRTARTLPLYTLCWQIHRGLTVPVPLLRMWVHCPRASNGPLPRRSNLVGYVRWDAQSDRLPPCQTIIPTAFRSQSGLPTVRESTNSVDSSAIIATNRH
jgi:hypothetical protein